MNALATARAEQIPVKIELKTKIKHDEQQETYELVAFGRYYQKGKSIYIKYDEIQEEGTVNTIVKITEGEAVILRSGALKMRLSFIKGNEMNGSYDSPYGTLLLTTRTKELQLDQSSEGKIDGHFDLRYQLLMQGSSVGVYEMNIKFKEE
ncbi:DUF1934 domain-containing protein [Falsibacillus pallidus]|uniref:DUF1934 domain-containing protein n=1 Tax=Falsibacillus pallidus TaxID=493781 RepID=UPI003CCC4C25